MYLFVLQSNISSVGVAAVISSILARVPVVVGNVNVGVPATAAVVIIA